MDTYMMAELVLAGRVVFSCMDKQCAKDILNELQGFFPCRVEPDIWETHDGDQFGWRIDRCQNKDAYALWWIMQQLCRRGWEPFAATSVWDEGYPKYLFRKRIQP